MAQVAERVEDLQEEQQFMTVARAVIRPPRGFPQALFIQRDFTDRYRPGAWEFPGGKLKIGETLEEGLKREVQAETGLAVSIVDMLSAGAPNRLPLDGQRHAGKWVQVFVALCQPQTSWCVRLSSEHWNYSWWTFGEIMEEENHQRLAPSAHKLLFESNASRAIEGWLQPR